MFKFKASEELFMNMVGKQVGLIICIVVMSFSIIGCGQREIEKLRSENKSLKEELSKLKETANYHYQKGIDFLSANKYEDAKVEFELVIKKYPLSPIVASSKQQIIKTKKALIKIEAQRKAEEKRRREEEKYRPRLQEEAFLEWKRFRRSEDKYKGTITTWKCKFVRKTSFSAFYGNVKQDASQLYLNGDYRYGVYVEGMPYSPGKGRYQESNKVWRNTEVKTDDWVHITMKFSHITNEGDLIFKPVRIKNLGYLE